MGADPDAEGGLVTFGVVDVEAAEAVELVTAGGEVVLASPYPFAFEPLELHATSALTAKQTPAKTTILRMMVPLDRDDNRNTAGRNRKFTTT